MATKPENKPKLLPDMNFSLISTVGVTCRFLSCDFLDHASMEGL